MDTLGFTALAVAGTLFALPVAGQGGCFRPPAPVDMVPPANDPKLRDFLGSEYETWIREMEVYLNCLGGEHVDASNEINEVLARWIYYYGDAAALHSDVRSDRIGDGSRSAPD